MGEQIATRLLSLLSRASREVVIVAPFMQRGSIERLLAAVPEGIPVMCVTRWHPEEVAAGVSDLKVFDAVVARQGAKLLLHPRLHAKLFRADDAQLVGSANVTNRALGWCPLPNLELLVLVDGPNDKAMVAAFENDLISESTLATVEIQDSVRLAAEQLVASAKQGGKLLSEALLENWVPMCPTPERLWSVYSNDSYAWQVIASAERTAKEDLQALDVPIGLTKLEFYTRIRSSLVGTQVAKQIDAMSAQGMQTTEGVQVLRALRPFLSEEGALAQLEIVLRWMQHFVPGEYRRAPTSEVFLRGRQIP